MLKFVTNFSKYRLQFLILSVLVSVSCQKTPIQFGQLYVDNSFSNIVLVDTLSMQLSTVYYDSVATSGSATILAGNYTDNIFGKIAAKSFFELAPPGTTTLALNSTFDSIQLILVPDKSYFGDTTFPMKLSVYQLQSPITFPIYQSQFYNNTDFPIQPSPIGTLNTQFYPNITDSVFIPLSNTIGDSLFNLIKNNDYIIQNTSAFIPYFSGLQLASGPGGNHAIYGFKDSVTMRVYYHQTDVFIENKFIDFKFYNNDNTQFNEVTSDRTGTPVAAFNNNKNEISSSVTGNTVYLQYLSGLVPKIKFPTVRSLLLRPDYVSILKAELIVEPVMNTYNPNSPLPPSLVAFTTDQNNLLGPPLISPATGNSYQTGNLFVDYLYNENTSYTYDVTSYLQQQLSIGYANQNGLLLVPPSPNWAKSFNRAVFGDQKNTQSSIQLKLYYVSVTP
jgi:hypothetical protein